MSDRGRKRRRLSPLSLEAIRAANEDLDDVQGARAYLKPLPHVHTLSSAWQPDATMDAIVDVLSGVQDKAGSVQCMWERKRGSRGRVNPRDLQLYTLDFSPENLAAALWAGFFVFGSEYSFVARPLEERGLMNFELAGPEVKRDDAVDPSGRLILDLSPGSAQRLALGKRSVRTVSVSAARREDAPGGGSGGGTVYRLSVCRAFERSWEAIVSEHGIDWCGFSSVRSAFLALHKHHPLPWERASVGSEGSTSGLPQAPKVISVELWDASRTDELVSAEVGVLCGRCYTCLSLFARRDEYPRCDWVRAQAGVLWLRRAGVELFDAGTTASYYADLFGFQRCESRAQFVRRWREKRGLEIASAPSLESACDDLRGLFDDYIEESRLCGTGGGAVGGGTRAADATAAAAGNGVPGGGTPAAARQQKHTVRLSGLPAGLSELILRKALLAALAPDEGGGSRARFDQIAKLSLVEHLGAAFVTFATAEAATAALALDGSVLPIGNSAGGGGGQIVCVAPHAKKAKSRKAKVGMAS
jgi:hypothetical protein